MGNGITASALLERLAADAGIPPDLLAEIFRDAPVDFPVRIGRHLPLGADRLGMAGITLFGRVYLSSSVERYPNGELIRLIRHEAEHVRQQRSDRLFYLRYAWQWMAHLARSLGKRRGGSLPKLAHDAYMAIEAEREAYAVDRTTRELMRAGGHFG